MELQQYTKSVHAMTLEQLEKEYKALDGIARRDYLTREIKAKIELVLSRLNQMH